MTRWLAIMMTVMTATAMGADDKTDFAIRDGDTVVFLGDSITAERTCGKIIENYTLLRFPGRKAHFVNVGKGGETASGVLERLERDVFSCRPTVLTVAYGVNDIGWGMKADEEHKQAYLRGIRTIVEESLKRKVRVYICSAAVTGADPNKSENDFLQKMCDEGMALSRSLGGGAIDVQRTMREAQKRVWAANEKAAKPDEKESLHAKDNVHLSEYGQIAMAFAILKGLGAPADVSAATLDAADARVIAAENCSVTKVRKTTNTIEFVRLDKGLPLNLGLIGVLSYRFVPIPDQINRYMLTVKNLPEGSYEVLADGRLVSKYTSGQLAGGVNIGSATPDAWIPGGPWDAQATVLRSLTDARSDMASGVRMGDFFLPDQKRLADIKTDAARMNREFEELQRRTARPAPYHFVVRPASPEEKRNP